MKKLYILTLAAAMLITTSCDDFLATDTPSKQSNTNVFNTEAMAEAALMGVYATMSDTYVYGQKISVNWQNISPAGHCVVAFVHAAQHLLPILPDRFPGVAGDGDLLLGAFVGG